MPNSLLLCEEPVGGDLYGGLGVQEFEVLDV